MKDNWVTKSILDIGDVISGGTPSTTINEFWDGDVVWITPADLSKIHFPEIKTSGKKITLQGLSSSSANLIPAGSIVMSSRAPIGYFAIPSCNFSTNQGCKSVKLKVGNDALFHYYNFQFNVNVIKRRGEGTTFAEISKKELEKLCFTFPESLPQQRKIASILSTCDEVIEKTEAAITKYQALKQGIMHDLFTRGIDLKTGKLRPSYQYGPELYKESDLGMIPKGWDVRRLEDIGQINYGKDYKANPKGDNIPIYGTGGIMGWTSLVLNSGPAVLTGRKGTINRPIYIEGDFWNVDTIFCINPRQNTNVKWFYFQMTSKDLLKLNEATGVPSVSSTALNNLKFSYPEQDEQDEIANRINVIEKKIEREQTGLAKYQQLKTGLMQDLLTGKVEVRVAEEIVKN